jgi:acetylornithine deacetylase/succinyl-diaminopimelate desuccinylase-like protein
MDHDGIRESLESLWDRDVLPGLQAFIEIPNQSPAFDAEWATNGLQERAVDHFVGWLNGLEIEGLSVEVLEPEGRTPLVLAEIEGVGERTAFFYGHLDKQPPFDGWDDDKGPFKPIVEGRKLYGRGSVDNGYGPLSAAAAIKALQERGIPHPRAVLFVELGEESGSPDLPYYFETVRERLGDVGLVVCPDSGCGDYDRLWFTSSLRGLAMGTLSISTVREGVHSGSASGIVPSSFRVLRQLLDRVERSETGEILVPELNVEIPEARREQAAETAKIVEEALRSKFPLHEGGRLASDDTAELLLNATWRPTLSVTGAAGLPSLENAGNVLRPLTAVQLSFRLPPGADPGAATEAIRRTLEADPPYGAVVGVEPGHTARGWAAPSFEPWLERAASEASQAFFGRDAAHIGEGGSIPLIATLGEMFPRASFVVTGLLGPESNAHGPNESLDLPAARRLSMCLAAMTAEMAAEQTG